MSVESVINQTVTSENGIEVHIGKEYVETPEFPGEDSEETAARYQDIARRHKVLYEQITVPVLWTHDDPYSSAAELREQLVGLEERGGSGE